LLRAAEHPDSEAIYGLLQQLAATYPPERASFDEVFPALVDDPDAILVVAEQHGIVQGYALAVVSLLLHTNGRSAQLQELVVDVDARGNGLGSRLLEQVERECAERGARQLTVASRRASAFYEARGFGVTADYLKRIL
jgi:N-acetylglutamate synthase-like GNAT family acetyltransferase